MATVMGTTRLEAFSDGVIAIIITIMVLDLRVPHGGHLAQLLPLFPVLLTYLLSFIYVGIYWNNHHHMLLAAERVTGMVLWANLHLLFWLSLIPFVTGWMGENHFETAPTALYGVVLLMCAFAYWLLEHAILHKEKSGSLLVRALGHDWKSQVSSPLYLCGIGAALFYPTLGLAFYVAVALLWFIPEPRIEKAIEAAEAETGEAPSEGEAPEA